VHCIVSRKLVVRVSRIVQNKAELHTGKNDYGGKSNCDWMTGNKKMLDQ
jgi:hypothetical protein